MVDKIQAAGSGNTAPLSRGAQKISLEKLSPRERQNLIKKYAQDKAGSRDDDVRAYINALFQPGTTLLNAANERKLFLDTFRTLSTNDKQELVLGLLQHNGRYALDALMDASLVGVNIDGKNMILAAYNIDHTNGKQLSAQAIYDRKQAIVAYLETGTGTDKVRQVKAEILQTIPRTAGVWTQPIMPMPQITSVSDNVSVGDRTIVSKVLDGSLMDNLYGRDTPLIVPELSAGDRVAIALGLKKYVPPKNPREGWSLEQIKTTPLVRNLHAPFKRVVEIEHHYREVLSKQPLNMKTVQDFARMVEGLEEEPAELKTVKDYYREIVIPSLFVRLATDIWRSYDIRPEHVMFLKTAVAPALEKLRTLTPVQLDALSGNARGTSMSALCGTAKNLLNGIWGKAAQMTVEIFSKLNDPQSDITAIHSEIDALKRWVTDPLPADPKHNPDSALIKYYQTIAYPQIEALLCLRQMTMQNFNAEAVEIAKQKISNIADEGLRKEYLDKLTEMSVRKEIAGADEDFNEYWKKLATGILPINDQTIAEANSKIAVLASLIPDTNPVKAETLNQYKFMIASLDMEIYFRNLVASISKGDKISQENLDKAFAKIKVLDELLPDTPQKAEYLYSYRATATELDLRFYVTNLTERKEPITLPDIDVAKNKLMTLAAIIPESDPTREQKLQSLELGIVEIDIRIYCQSLIDPKRSTQITPEDIRLAETKLNRFAELIPDTYPDKKKHIEDYQTLILYIKGLM